jgi:phosphate transport system substrate-binding protein
MSSKKKHRKRMLSIALPALAFLMISWMAFAGETLRIGGVGSALGSMKLLGAAFERLNPDTRVTVVRSLGSGGGILAVAKGAVDIGVSGRPLTEEERKLELSAIEYAKTPVVFAVKTDHSTSGLSRGDMISMIEGKTTTWPDGLRSRAVLRPLSDAESEIIKKAAPDVGLAIEEAIVRGGMIVSLTAQEAADAIERIPGAFGISTLSLIESERRPLRAVPFDGVSPSEENVNKGAYPFVMTYYILTKPQPSKVARVFIDFVQSAPGRKILEESGNYVVPREK